MFASGAIKTSCVDDGCSWETVTCIVEDDRVSVWLNSPLQQLRHNLPTYTRLSICFAPIATYVKQLKMDVEEYKAFCMNYKKSYFKSLPCRIYRN